MIIKKNRIHNHISFPDVEEDQEAREGVVIVEEALGDLADRFAGHVRGATGRRRARRRRRATAAAHAEPVPRAAGEGGGASSSLSSAA